MSSLALLLLLTLSASWIHTGTANHLSTVRADLWVNNVQHFVTFTAGQTSGADYHVSPHTPSSSLTFAIHMLPIDYTADPTKRCNTTEIGSRITDQFMFASEATNVNVNVSVPMLAFRSLVVYNDSTRVGCGNILPQDNPHTFTVLKAAFTTQVGGSVYVIQSDEDDTYIIGKLFSTTVPTSSSYRMASYPFVNFFAAAKGSCPDGIGTGTTISDSVWVQASPAPYADGAFYIYSNFLTATSLSNTTLALTDGNNFLSCALLQLQQDVGTSVGSPRPALSQILPYTYAFVLGNYIRQYEVYSDANNPGVACVNTTIYDPLGVGSTGTAPGDIPVGDLPRKGTIQPNNIPEVPIMGPYTIVGRRVNDSGCGFLRPASSGLERIIMATATFNGAGVNGSIVFRQIVFDGGVLGPTFITQGLYYGNGSSATMGHNWHVHQRRRDTPTTCVVGGHYNPFNVNLTQPNYGADCGRSSQFRCEMGDQSGKHGKLTVKSMQSPEVLYDENLHLAGPFTILGRSIVLHTPEGPYMTCANIEAAVLSATVITINFPKFMFNPIDLDFRFALADSVSRRAGVPPGDVLVYEAESHNVSSTQCIRATLRTTGRDMAEADRNAQAVLAIDVQDLEQFSEGNICGTTPPNGSSGFSPKVSAVAMVILALVAFLFG